MKYLSIFSGIEAASVAWEPLGWEPVAFAEVDPFPCAVLSERYPRVPNLGDVTLIDWSPYHGTVDVLIGGSPCQSFSVAGGRESLDGPSRLMFEFCRAVREVKPRYFVWENVPGCLSTKDNAFGQLLDEMEKSGYSDIAWRVLDAQFFGVAQRRRRVFLVGRLGEGFCSAAVLFERESLCGDYPTSREKREELAAAASRSAKGESEPITASFRTDHLGQNGKIHSNELASTLDIASAPPAVLTQYGGEIAGTLRRRYDSSPTPDNGQNVVLCRASAHANAETCEGMAPTLAARQHKDPPILIDRAAFNQGENAQYPPPHRNNRDLRRAGIERATRYCLSNGEDVTGPLCARDHKGVGSEYINEGKVVCTKTDS